MGLIPYIFRTSRHLVFTLSLGFPIWLRLIISRFTHRPKKTVAHFLPDGAPDWLNPFLVLIETTRVFVRPLTLSFRLAANMRAGHIVLRLMGIYCAAAWFSRATRTIFLIAATLGYILFEVAICLIQAYIFCLLLSLYSDDHAH
jgi:ATP synthase subunit 6